MAHPRKGIRDGIATILGALATTGSRVYPSRTHNYNPSTAGGPGLFIYTLDEESEPDTLGPVATRGTTRRLKVLIHGIGLVNDTIDDTLDAIALEVENAMNAAGNSLGGLCKDHALSQTQVSFHDMAEYEAGHILMTYDVLYRTTSVGGVVTNEGA